MTDANTIRFQATDIDPSAEADLALLTFQTAENGRVTVWMKRPVFDALFVRMQHVLEQEHSSTQPPAKP